MDKDKLIKYCEEGLSTNEIARIENKSQTNVRCWLKKFGLKTSGRQKYKISDEDLLNASRNAESFSEIFRTLKIRLCGGAYYHYKKRLVKLGVDISKFNRSVGGKVSARNRNKEAIAKDTKDRVKRSTLKKYMDLNNIPYICFNCKIDSWNGQKLHLQIHHKDENRTNNSLENLCYLCPNCHSIEHYDANGNIKNRIVIKKEYFCLCGKKRWKTALLCQDCRIKVSKENRKFSISKEELYDLLIIKKLTYIKIGEMFGVADRTVSKRAKNLEIIK